MSPRLGVVFLLVMTVLAVWMDSESRFVGTTEVKEKKDNSHDKSDSSEESTEDSREKKSGEEIMFGNQQNKASGFVEDMMGMSNNREIANPDDSKRASDTDSKNDTDNKEEDDDHKKLEEALKDDDKRTPAFESNGETDETDRELAKAALFDGSPLTTANDFALQYMMNRAPLQPLPSPNEDINPIYDQEEVYRRKRQLSFPAEAVPLRKRSLRSPLGQMIQTRGRRLPRRSMRYKRQVKLEDLLNFLGKNDVNTPGRFYDEQVSPINQNPVHFRDAAAAYRYPYNMDRNEPDVFDEEEEDAGSKEDMSNALLLSPSGRYFEPSDFPFPYGSKSEDDTVPVQYPDWLDRGAPHPSVFSVSRRSAPFFYPLDYRYIPGYKKKRSMLGEKNEQEDTNFGKWGRVVQTPNDYASAEDVARLYALANLLAGEDNPNERNRRAA